MRDKEQAERAASGQRDKREIERDTRIENGTVVEKF